MQAKDVRDWDLDNYSDNDDDSDDDEMRHLTNKNSFFKLENLLVVLFVNNLVICLVKTFFTGVVVKLSLIL